MSFLNIFKKPFGKPGKTEEKKPEAIKAEKKPVVSDIKTPRLRSESAKPKREKKTTSGRAHVVLVRPIVSEKATDFGQYGKYVFEVAGDANKIQVKKAIQDVYGVEAVTVNIVNKQGKKVRFGRSTGRTKAKKKAIVTLRTGETISLYEGV